MSKDIRPYNDKNQRHGYWESYWDNKPWCKCTYNNGRLVGYDEYYPNTNKSIKTFHII